MTAGKSKPVVMPLRVFVGPRTEAEKAFHARKSMPRPEAIVPGIPPSPAHDLIFRGGHTIADLVFTNFYIGGTAAWKASDIENIDENLAAAMSDVDLNVMAAGSLCRTATGERGRPFAWRREEEEGLVAFH